MTADRNYIKEFILARRLALGKKHGVEYAEAYHYVGPGSGHSVVDEYVKKNAVPMK